MNLSESTYNKQIQMQILTQLLGDATFASLRNATFMKDSLLFTADFAAKTPVSKVRPTYLIVAVSIQNRTKATFPLQKDY